VSSKRRVLQGLAEKVDMSKQQSGDPKEFYQGEKDPKRSIYSSITQYKKGLNYILFCFGEKKPGFFQRRYLLPSSDAPSISKLDLQLTSLLDFGISSVIVVHQSSTFKHLIICVSRDDRPSVSARADSMRYSGLQKEVLALYRKCLRESRKKPVVSAVDRDF